MNHFKARQRKDGRWDYTCRNDNYIFPVGYCDEYRPLDDRFPADPVYDANKDKHHTSGHATPEEARECYNRYLLDQQLRLNLESTDTQRRCQVCQEWTSLFADLDCHIYELCEKHNNREEVEKLFKGVGEIWSS